VARFTKTRRRGSADRVDRPRRPRRFGTSAGIEDDTASICCGFEPSSHRGFLELLDYGSQHGEVHATNELGVVPGQRVDGAIGQHDRAVGAAWCVPALSQRFAGAVEKSFSAWLRTSGRSGLISDDATQSAAATFKEAAMGCRPGSRRRWHRPGVGRRGRIGVQARSPIAVGWIGRTAWWDARLRGIDAQKAA
jgi:hypothetical protein